MNNDAPATTDTGFPRAESIGIDGKCVGQDLDGDIAIQLGVARTIDLAHAALSKQPDDLVWT